jgi:serine/threonine protein kinase
MEAAIMPETPQSFGQYDLLEQLSKSTTGVIWKARHRMMGRVVALKVLARHAAGSVDFSERYLRTTKILSQLSHPNLVMASEAGREGDSFYLVMEYVDGQNLTVVLNARGPLPVADAVRCIFQAAQGLAYAHQHGVCHRDIKPGNLMVDRSGVVKVVGFGMARIEADSEMGAVGHDGLTQQGQILGTYDYMPPEQAIDSRTVDPRCDVYSLGCTLHALLIGRPPYPGKSITAQIMAHQGSPIPVLRTLRPDVPEWLDRVFAKMLAKRPEDRWQSMEEVITALTAGATQGQASPAATGDSSSKQVTGVAQSTDRAGGPNAKDKSASSPTPGPVPKKGWFKWFSIGIVFLGPATVGPILTRLI